MQYPLEGVKVLDLSRILAGPVCCQLLADLGADVVKVERPGAGDDTRQWGPPFLENDGPSAYYLSCNRGKRSLAMDLARPESRSVLEALVAQADILVENFLPDTVAKLGLSPQRLAQLNPRLVSCSISGYGRTGPLADVPGYDLVIQAGSGLMSITGEPEGRPMKVGVAISDVITGLYAAASALAGLSAQRREARPWAFDLALADCTLASLVNVVQSALVTGQRPRRWGNAHPNIVPYEAVATADGFLVLAVGNDRQFQRFCEAAGRAEWAVDPRFSTNPARVQHREELLPQIDELMRARTTEEWRALLTEADVPHGPVAALDEIFAEPQVGAREMIGRARDGEGRETRLLNGAVQWQGQPPRAPRFPPAVGQHTDEVLRQWLALDERRLAELRAAGAIA